MKEKTNKREIIFTFLVAFFYTLAAGLSAFSFLQEMQEKQYLLAAIYFLACIAFLIALISLCIKKTIY